MIYDRYYTENSKETNGEPSMVLRKHEFKEIFLALKLFNAKRKYIKILFKINDNKL